MPAEPGSDGRRPDRVVVVGGGIAGLAAAYALRVARPDLEVTVLEAAPAVGGKLRVEELAGVPVDTGAEALLARRPEAVELARAVGLGADVVHPETTRASVWHAGRLVPFPDRTVLGIPGDLAGLAGSPLFSLGELARMGAERGLGGLPLTADVAVGTLVADRLGPAVRDRLLEPLLGGVYAGHADALSLDATVPALGEALRRHTSLLDATAELAAAGAARPHAPVFAGLDGGVGRLPAAVAVASGATVRTRTTVRALHRTPAGRWQLVVGPTPSAELVEADAVVLAVPAAPAARLLTDVVPVAASRLAELRYASVGIVTLAYRSAGLAGRLNGSGFLVPPSERRLVKGSTFSSAKWGWLAARDPDLVVVRGSVGRQGEERDLQREDGELAAAVAADLADVLGAENRPVATVVTRWGGALPQYAVGHRELVAAVKAAVAAHRGLAVAGAAYDGIGIAACVASGQEAATRVLADLAASATMAP